MKLLLAVFLFALFVHHKGFVQAQDLNFSRINSNYTVFINSPVNTRIAEYFRVAASSPSSNNIEVACDSVASSPPSACTRFGLSSTDKSPSAWVGHLVISQGLTTDYTTVYVLQLQATNGVLTSSMTVTIIIPDVPPVFTSPMSAPVGEINDTVSHLILQLEARDRNQLLNRQVQYSLVSNPGEYFNLDSVTGRLFNRKQLLLKDRNWANGYITLLVKAAVLYNSSYVPMNDSNYATTAQVTVTLLAYETAPIFSQTTFSVTLPEKSLAGTVVPNTDVVVTSSNQGSSSAFSLSIDPPTDMFFISPLNATRSVTASILVANNSRRLDGDLGQRVYNFRVVATSRLTSVPLSSSINVTISLTDINDHAPVFTQSIYSFSLPENIPGNTPIGNVLATDLDFDSVINGNASIRYRLDGTGAGTLFRIGSQSGQVTTAPCTTPGRGTCIDYERKNLYFLTITAADRYGEGFVVRVTLNLSITNVNDNPPLFSQTDYPVLVYENSSALPLQVQASDLDNNVLTFSLSNTFSNLFSINASTGVISLNRPIRYTDVPRGQASITLPLSVFDGNYTATSVAHITVQPVNLYAPQFQQVNNTYIVHVPEDARRDGPILTLLATDADSEGTPGHIVTYRIDNGGFDDFVVNASTGVVSVAPTANLNYALRKDYNIIVSAVDQGQPQKTATGTIIVHILPQNVSVLLFIPSTFTGIVPKNVEVGYQVINVTTYTRNTNAEIRYTIGEPFAGFSANNTAYNLTAAERAWFTIDPSTGWITVNSNISRDTIIRRWRSLVFAEDTVNHQTATGTIFITINEVNDKPPQFISPWAIDRPYYFTNFISGQPARTYVQTMVATEPNNNLIKYMIVNSTGGNFSIIPETGVITTSSVLTYDPNVNVSFVVVAYDNGLPPLSSTATVYVMLSVFNIYAPAFNSTSYSTAIRENSPGGTSVVQLYATDTDSGNFGQVRYQLIENPLNAFVINDVTGLITVAPNATLDAEQHQQLELTAAAYDSPDDPAQRRYTYIPVIVSLQDVNDNAPKFTQASYSTVLPATFSAGLSVLAVSAHDDDITSPNNLVSYEIAGSPVAGVFAINSSTGLLTSVWSLSSLSGVYTLTIRAYDHGTDPRQLSSTCLVSITVLGSAQPPQWIVPAYDGYSIDVRESVPAGTVVFTVIAHAANPNSNATVIVYSMADVNGRSDFGINGTTGDIVTNRPLNFSTVSIYVMILNATDNNGGTSITHLGINVIPFAIPIFPFFTGSNRTCCSIPYDINVNVTTERGQRIGFVQASTENSLFPVRYLHYKFLESSNMFAIDSNGGLGVLTLASSTLSGSDLNKVFTLTVRADYDGNYANASVPPPGCDCGNRSDVFVNLHIVSVVGPSINFPQNGYILCLSEDADAGDVVGSIAATASYPSPSITYTMSPANVTWSDGTSSIQQSGYLELRPDGMGGATLVVSGNRPQLRMLPYATTFTVFINAEDSVARMAARTNATIVVTKPQYRVLVTVDKNMNAVNQNTIINMVKEHSNKGAVCVDAVRPHVDPGTGGIANYDQTDFFLYVVNGSTNLLVTDVTYHGLDIGYILDDRIHTSVIGITMAYFYWHGFDVVPIAAAIGIIIGLLLIALLMLCCCCCWGSILALFAGIMESGEPTIIHVPGVPQTWIDDVPNPPWEPQMENQHLTMALGAEAMDYGNGVTALAGSGGRFYDDRDVFQGSMSREQLITTSRDSQSQDGGAAAAAAGSDVRIVASLSGSRSVLGTSAVGGGTTTVGGETAAGGRTTVTTTYKHEEKSYRNADGYDDVDGRPRYLPSPAAPVSTGPAPRSTSTARLDEPAVIVPLNENAQGSARIGATLYQAPTPHSGFTATQRVVSTAAYPGPDTNFTLDTTTRRLPLQNEMTYNMHSSSVIYDDYDDYVSGYPPGTQQQFGSGDGMYTGEVRLRTMAPPQRRFGSTSGEQETRFA